MLTKKYKIMKKQFIVIEEGTSDYFIVSDLKVLIEEMYGEYNDETENSFYRIHTILEVKGEIKNISRFQSQLIMYIYVNQKYKIMFIKIDYEMGFSSICDNENEVMNCCGYDENEISFSEFLEKVKGEYEIIKVKGKVEFLND